MSTILVVDDEPQILEAFEHLLVQAGYEVRTERTAESALECLAEARPDLVVMDVWLPGINGISAFRKIRERQPRVPVVLMTGAGTTEIAIEASMLGAFEYRRKPIDPEDMLALIERALHSTQIMQESKSGDPQPRVTRGSRIVGEGPKMQEVYRAIGRVAATDATVLIRGESGTGKELVARALHEHSPRSTEPLVTVNCVAIPETLLESELFGYERGAFTGAVGRRIGRFEQAGGGTILLDEIGDVPLSVQAKILRVLQEKCFERLGGNDTLKTCARVLATTNRDLEKAIAAARFRGDLYYRLNVVSISLPPLRERREDIPQLIQYFLERFSSELEVEFPRFSREARELLETHSWPGNVRELEHCIKRTMIFSGGFPIQVDDVRRALELDPRRRGTEAAGGPSPAELRDYVRRYLEEHAGPEAHVWLMDETERLLLLEALRLAKGKQTRAAAVLGIPRPTLHLKLRKHSIRIESSAEPEMRQKSEESSRR